MKFLRQFLIILTISFLGEALKYLLPLPIPASIYGMVILFMGLLMGLIRLEWVKDAGKFLIAIMPVMFIPAGVGLMASWGKLKSMLIPVIVVTVVAIITVMFVTGTVSQLIIRMDKKAEMKKMQVMEEKTDE
ncbi:MAG: CidA/LrgA family protein [Clostridia bacterium]|jgi:holin-like protein|nr:CidA/LrgA family protein [Clostridia bacterium]